MEKRHIRLGPLFPRLVAVYIGIVVVIACWGLPLVSPLASETGKLASYILGLLILIVLFVPSYGTVTVDPDERCLTFLESVTAGCLHPWRGREVCKLKLPEGSTVLIGFWLGVNGFATGGVQVNVPSGASPLLFENKFGVDERVAGRLAAVLRTVKGVKVRTVRLSPTFEMVDWSPAETPGVNTASLFFLSWVAFPLGMLKSGTAVILGVGVACFAAYSIAMLYRVSRRAQKTEVNEEKMSIGGVFGFGMFQFALMYTVMAILGGSIRQVS